MKISALLKLDKYIWIAWTSVKSNLAYAGEVGSRVIFLAVILYIFLRLWVVTYSQTGATTLGGLNLTQMIWYLAVTESIILSAPRVSEMVDRDVRTGQLAVHLIKPLSYPLYCLGHCLGERTVRFFMNLAIGLSISWIFVGPVELGLANIAFLLLSLPLAFLIDFLGNFAIGLGAFWLEDTTGLMLIYSRVTMILGGMLIPIELFPTAAQPLLKALPFASIVYGPARMLVRPDMDGFIELLIHQAAAASVFALFVYVLYRRCSRRVMAQGG